MGVVVRRYIDFLILHIPTPVVLAFYAAASLLLCCLTLGTHAHSEGYCNCPMCVHVRMCVYVCVSTLICRLTHEITQKIYQQIHHNTGIVLNFADFPKNVSLKNYDIVCVPRAAAAS